MLKVLDRWTVARKSGKGTRGRCTAECECGDVSEYEYSNITTGNTTRCRKCAIASRGENKKTHGHSMARREIDPIGYSCYTRWQAMKRRCNNKSESSYMHYGGRGIKVCDRWINSYENFLSDMGLPPTIKHQIDRSDNDGDYEPSNCKWVSQKENSNNKRNNIKLTAFGRTMNLCQWSDETGEGRSTITRRLKFGWTTEEAVTGIKYKVETPLGKFKSASEAARAHNVSTSTMHGWFVSGKMPDYIKF